MFAATHVTVAWNYSKRLGAKIDIKRSPKWFSAKIYLKNENLTKQQNKAGEKETYPDNYVFKQKTTY